MRLNVLLGFAPTPTELATLQQHLHPDIQLYTDENPPPPGEADWLVKGRPAHAQIELHPGLRGLIVPWAGLPGSTRELMREYPHISVHNLHHNATQTAELGAALLLAAAKFLVPVDQALRNDDWRPRYQPPRAQRLAGKTALILGFGHIGQRLARICNALDMCVIATRRQPEKPLLFPLEAEIHPPEALHRLLPRANALLITLPLTEHTRNLIREMELALLPDNALLVNIARGPIVDEAALYYALREGRLAAAGMDVWWNYPQDEESRQDTAPSSYPFRELDNVVMSPHRGGSVIEDEQQRMVALAELLNAAARGEEIPNRVDLEAGY